MGHSRLVAVALAAFLLAGCSKDTWEAYAYPNRSDLATHDALGEFLSLEACRAAAVSYLQGIRAAHRGDYECGLNCKPPSSPGGPKVCERTER
jgi:hypothetical protein